MKKYSVTVTGQTNKWTFSFTGDPEHVEHWRADGLEIDEIVNTIPEAVADVGLGRVWTFFQDLFNFRNPFKG